MSLVDRLKAAWPMVAEMPDGNVKVVVGLTLVTVVVLVALAMMAAKQPVDRGTLEVLLAAALTVAGFGAWRNDRADARAASAPKEGQ
jgi:hypothetical protein